MELEAISIGTDAAGRGKQLLLRDGKYHVRLSFSDHEQPCEVILHGVSHLADAQTIANILEGWLAGRSHTL